LTREIDMETPRLHGYPFDQEVVRQIRARQRAREAERLNRRSARGPAVGLRGFLQRLSG
jgi:hypothetical protein